ncbi:MAG: pantoate--beta-alanine ligase [Rickettsiales bacterium]
MIVTKNIDSLQQELLKLSQAGKTVALVPTMGALHLGHSSLINKAKEIADAVVVSIFINPRQFSANEDFNKYPKNIDSDIETAKSTGCDLIYAPDVEDMYSENFATSINTGEMGKSLCGQFRDGHFDGVATVVIKLLLRIMPHYAVFGMKDYQQLRIIERMVYDLDIPTEIISAPTIRDDDGLALSSRNSYLSDDERKIAPLLYKKLCEVAKLVKDDSEKTEDILSDAIKELSDSGFDVEYLKLCDAYSLEEIENWEENCRLFVAARLGSTRLIDNIEV